MTTYLMEDPIEAERLEIKTKREKVQRELEYVPLEPGYSVLEVGCGTGAVTRILSDELSLGTVVGLDFSLQRLQKAVHMVRKEGRKNIRFVCSDLLSPGLGKAKFDLAYSRCTFQYLGEEGGKKALKKMKDLVKPGGRVVVADVDGVCLFRTPVDPVREVYLELLFSKLEPTFDAYMGRKLYRMFLESGFKDIRVDLLPYYLIAGRADPTTVRVWEMKVEIIRDHLDRIFGSRTKADEVANRFLADFEKEDVLLYNTLFIVQGVS